MAILLVLVPISLVLLGIAAWTFIWAVRAGQFDDLDTPAIDILSDDAPVTGTPAKPVESTQSAESTQSTDKDDDAH